MKKIIYLLLEPLFVFKKVLRECLKTWAETKKVYCDSNASFGFSRRNSKDHDRKSIEFTGESIIGSKPKK